MDEDRIPSAEDRSCDILLTGGAVLTMDTSAEIFEPGAVAIKGDRIAAVGLESDLSLIHI